MQSLPCCLSSTSSASLRFPHCPVQSLDIDCNLCHNSLFYVYNSKDNANERNESLLSNCRVQLILCKITGQVCQIVAQARKLSQKSLYHLVPIIPGTAYGRMIHRHHFHLLAITQKISTRSNRITIHYNVVAILPAYIRKIVQTSAMRACSQIAECSLSYTKIVQ